MDGRMRAIIFPGRSGRSWMGRRLDLNLVLPILNVQPALLLLLTLEAALGAAAAWLGFTGRRRYARRYRVVSIVCALVVTPLLGYTLVRQTQAVDELAGWGVEPHPATRTARGLPTSHVNGGSWSFAVDAPHDSILAFHRASLPAHEWRLSLVHPSVLLFERDGHELMVSVKMSRGSPIVAYVIDRVDDAGAP